MKLRLHGLCQLLLVLLAAYGWLYPLATPADPLVGEAPAPCIDSAATLSDSSAPRTTVLPESLPAVVGDTIPIATFEPELPESLASAPEAAAPPDTTAVVAPPEDSTNLDLIAPGELDLTVLTALTSSDDYGLIALHRSFSADTTTIRPFRFAPRKFRTEEPVLLQIYRRMQAQRFLLEKLNMSLDFFRRSDSLATLVRERVDLLVVENRVSPTLLYRPPESGQIRYLPPPVRNMGKETQARSISVEQTPDIAGRRITRTRYREATPLDPVTSEGYGEYVLHMMHRTRRDFWAREIRDALNDYEKHGGRSGLKQFSLPFEMPKAVRSIFGEGRPNLTISGSERISFGGTSRWRPNQPAYEYKKQQSKFPQLEMDQDLDINVAGSVGDKLDIDVNQSSKAEDSFANQIRIHYKGYEDEIIRRLDLGNTSLSLPGTEYVSYGGRHEGLFGINAEAQFGPVTVNMIVSKQEGESAEESVSLGGKSKEITIDDHQYVRDRFFFLDDPTRDAYPEHAAFVRSVLEGSVILYLDDGLGTAAEFAVTPGFAVLNLETPDPGVGAVMTDLLEFEQLEYDRDYWIFTGDRYEEGEDETFPYIVLNRSLDANSTLAITYTDQIRNQQVGGLNAENILYAKMIRPKDDDLADTLSHNAWGETSRLMLKNVYSLHAGTSDWGNEGLPEAAILKEGFELSIHYRGTLAGIENPDQLDGTKLIRYAGLDYFEETDEGYVAGQDGSIDVGIWVDLGHGLIFFPDFQPFAPTPESGGLRGRPPPADEWDQLPEEYLETEIWNPDIYDLRNSFRRTGDQSVFQSKFFMKVSYKSPITEIRIQAWDIIEGSEVVTVGGRRLAKDVDYRINYQTGVVSILDSASIPEDQEIGITYKKAGGFGTASKTLLGAAATYQPPESKFSLSTSWLYESKGSPDRRPRLGSEPTRTAVGEIGMRYATESMRLTRWLDKLPGLETRRTSKLNFEGGLGVSFPNPNTKNDLYLDDFEGVADDISVRLNRQSWNPTGIPAAVKGFDAADQAARRGELWWYTPYHQVQEGDYNPTLDSQEADDFRQVLEMQFHPYPSPDTLLADYWEAEESWGGIVQALSNNDLDLSQARFLDVWINDFVSWNEFRDDPTLRHGTMYVEIGRVNEDALWQRRPVDCSAVPFPRIIGNPIGPPNGQFDTEDSNGDARLDISDDLNEDTGFDRKNAGESGDTTIDDYVYEQEPEEEVSDDELCTTWAGINGMEANGRLDTEDLDGDYSMDRIDAYYRFKIGLDDSTFLETDVQRDYPLGERNWPLDDDNGWRRIRIPLSDAYVDSFVGNPSWTRVKHLRIWFTGRDMETRRRIQIGGIDIRSNRWIVQGILDSHGDPLTPAQLSEKEEDFFPGVVNNKQNADIYEPPFEVHRQQDNNNIREREQSLTLEMRNFGGGHTGSLYQKFHAAQNYMGYEYLEFWLNSTVPEDQEVEFYLRLCKEVNADTTHYYEYRAPVPKSVLAGQSGAWQGVKIKLTDFSDLKLLEGADEGELVWAERPDGSQLRMKGRPYLTNINRISMGVVNPGSPGTAVAEITSASVWINELRLTHVFKEPDVAYRFSMRSELSDFAKFDISYKRIGADFVSISGGGFHKRKETETHLNTTTNMPIDRFLPKRFGLKLPLNFSYNRTRRVPKYRTNDDVLVGNDPSDRDLSLTVSRNATLSISRTGSRSNLMKYTLDAIKLSGSIKQNFQRTPTLRDSTQTLSYSAGYSATLGEWGNLPLYKDWKLRLTPTNLSVSMNRNRTDRAKYRRRNSDLRQPFIKDDDRVTRTGLLSISSGLRPIQSLKYTFTQSRDLMLKEKADWLGGLNIGQERARDEKINFSHTLRAWKGWFEPRLSWKGGFTGKFHEQSGTDLERSSTFTNNRATTLTSDLTLVKLLSRLASLGRGGVETEGAAAGAEQAAPDDVSPEEAEETPGSSRGRQRERARPSEGRTAGAQRGNAGRGGPSFIGRYLSLTKTSGSFSTGNNTTFQRVQGEPSLAYQLGLSLNPEAIESSKTRDSRTDRIDYGADFDFKVLRSIVVSTNWSKGKTKTRNEGSLTETDKATWPRMDIRWGDLSKQLPKDWKVRKFFKSMKANTSYARTTEERTQQQRTTTNWTPLLDLKMSMPREVSMTLRMTSKADHTEHLTGTQNVTDYNNSNFTLTTKKTFSITRQVKIPLTDRTQRMVTKMDLSLAIRFDKTKNTSQSAGQPILVTKDMHTLDISLGGSYEFTKRIKGNLSISFKETANNKTKIDTMREVGMSVSARFSF